MNWDWRSWKQAHPLAFALLVIVKRFRTTVGAVLVVGFLVEGVFNHEQPLDLHRPSPSALLGLFLLGIGFAFRFYALAGIRKQKLLARTGAYSLCRHPLYFGTTVMAIGFCILINDIKSYFVMALYLSLFYPLTILWEETRLDERFGDLHRRYAQTTPTFLPTGRLVAGPCSLHLAWRNGVGTLAAMTIALLICLESMAETVR